MSVSKQNQAGLFDLILKNANEVIDRIYAPSLADAKEMYRLRKQMDLNSFNSLFDVCQSPERKR